MDRSTIKKYLNDSFEKTRYSREIRRVKDIDINKITIADLDFMDTLRDLYLQIKDNYDKFISNKLWVPSDRQKFLLEMITNICKNTDGVEKLQIKDIHMFDDLYWQIYDYFDDYGNKDDSLCREEIDMILTHLKKLFDK